MGWFEQRHIERPKASKLTCVSCKGFFWLPKSKEKIYKTCSSACDENNRAQQKLKRLRNCLICNKEFIPRPFQIAFDQGKYCSNKCATFVTLQKTRTKEVRKKASKARKQSLLDGKWTFLKGELSPSWNGGKEAIKQRLLDKQKAGITAQKLREYRKRNPHKVREFNKRRNERKTGRLPTGTIQSIGDSQEWKCVICRCCIKHDYHMDHIYPLAKGGKHEKYNIQLLCPTCNVRKSAKDPIQFMQENNYLL